ncbi:hypothetical protein RRG08_001021 [Elysia crispata]|uniref:Uncharacterized protein n=1 Tax=Elysia crispata TaxID=231223 RepID=A0AAE1AVN7_9GAST|nr:hypothetical protein RRG08_001021 [Elysia crispata]
MSDQPALLQLCQQGLLGIPKGEPSLPQSLFSLRSYLPNLSNYGDVKPFTEIGWKKICDIKCIRLQSDNPKIKLSNICEQIPEAPNDFCHGYHRPCYQTFTSLRQTEKRKANEQEEHSPRKKRTLNSQGTTLLLPSDQCLFCKKKNKYVKRKQDYLVKCVTETAKMSILNAAQQKSDSRVLGIVETACLIAREAHYHESCRRDYTRNVAHTTLPTSTCNIETQSKMEEAHSQAFHYICDYVQKHIIDNATVERMTMLREKYLTYLQSKYPQEYNPNYKTDKLKQKLQKHFGEKVQFWQPNYRSELVYSNEVPRTDEETYDDDSFDSDFLDDSSEDEEDIATDDEDGV